MTGKVRWKAKNGSPTSKTMSVTEHTKLRENLAHRKRTSFPLWSYYL